MIYYVCHFVLLVTILLSKHNTVARIFIKKWFIDQITTNLVIKYIVKFCITQNTPTQKSATAKFAKKKFVIDLSLLDNVTTNITRRFPEIKQKTIIFKKFEKSISC